jgi:hypothetical protein
VTSLQTSYTLISISPESPLLEGNNIVYGQGGSAVAATGTPGLEPFFVTALRAATGHSVTLPLAVSDATVLLGASDGLLYVQTRRLHVPRARHR